MMSEADAHFARAMLQRRAQLLRSFLDRHGFDYVNRPRSLKGSLIFCWFMNMFDILCTYFQDVSWFTSLKDWISLDNAWVGITSYEVADQDGASVPH